MTLPAFLHRFGTALASLVLFAFFAVAANAFLSVSNLLNVLKHISYLAVLGIGFAVALTTGELDLSFANVASLATVATGGLVHHGHPVALAVLAGLGIGVACGTVNGILVAHARIPSLIATLAMAAVANGLAFMFTGGVAFVGRWPESFLFIGRGEIFGIPTLIVWAGVVAALVVFVLKRTRLGLHMTATGEAGEAARLAGISVRRMKVLGLAASGLAAGITAVLLASSLSSAAPNSAGDFMLTGIATVLLGMTMFEPGRPNVPGVLVGAFTIGMLSNGLVLLGAQYYIQDIVLGAIIVGSVAVSSLGSRRAALSL